MGRPAQPIEVIKAKGKSHHLTKAEIQHRKDNEIKFGTKELVLPYEVENDTIAYKKWKEMIEMYGDVEWLATPDSDSMAEYCLVFSELKKLQLRSKQTDDHILSEFIKLDNQINRKRDQLIKLQDRMFLNPASRIKNIPKKPKEEVSEFEKEFG